MRSLQALTPLSDEWEWWNIREEERWNASLNCSRGYPIGARGDVACCVIYKVAHAGRPQGHQQPVLQPGV